MLPVVIVVLRCTTRVIFGMQLKSTVNSEKNRETITTQRLGGDRNRVEI